MEKPVRVLHVDDDPQFGDLVATYLEREAGLRVLTEASAAAGLETLEETAVDCVVSDYDMPGMTGLEFLDAVRERAPELPFILFTGKGSEEIASDAISAGVTDYMQKESGTDQYTVLANRVRNSARQYLARREAERTRNRLEEITDASTDCIWMFDADWEELLFVSGYEAVWNRPAAAIEENPQDFLNGVHPEDRAFVEEVMARLSAGESVDVQYRIQRPDAGVGWVWVKGEPITDETGAVQRVVGFTRDVTERKHRERELTREREFTNQALDALGDVFYLVDTDRRLERWNQSLSRAVGHDEDQLAGLAMSQLVSPDDRDRIEAAIDEVLEGGESTVEASLRTAEGDEIPYEFTGSRLTRPDGSVRGVVGVGRDVSERQARERELRQSERRFEAVLNDPNILVGLLDTDGTLLEVNETAMSYIDAEPEMVTGEPFWETPWWDGEMQPVIRDAIERAAGGEYVTYHNENQQKTDDEPYTVEGSIRPVTDESGTVVSLIVSSRDVTERVVRETRLEAVLENTTTPMFMKEQSGEYLLVNDAFLDLFGFEETAVLGSTDADLFPEAMATEVRANDLAVLESGAPVETEERIRTGGQERVFLTSKVPIHDIGTRSDAEQPVAVFGVANDITKRKRWERKIERQNDQFDEFANVISHDLKSPIATVRGRIELAAETAELSHLEGAKRALDRVDDLRSDIAGMLRARQVVGDRDEVSVAELAETAWEGVDAGSGCSMRTDTAATVEADPDATRRLLQNLLSNAVEHGDDGVRIEVGALADGTGFYVADDGPGIPESRRDDVLTPGFTTKPDGDGIGMASVLQIVEGHGWELSVRASPALGGARIEIRTAVGD